MLTYKRGKGLGYLHPRTLSADDAATLHYAVSVYGFLLNDWGRTGKQFTWGEFAALIRQRYAATPRTLVILAVIERVELCLAKTGIADAELGVCASAEIASNQRGRGARRARRARKTRRSISSGGA